MGSVNRISPLILRKIHFRAIISCDSFERDRMSGWPSGLRRQTQELNSSPISEHSGPRMRAWVRIPLLTTLTFAFS